MVDVVDAADDNVIIVISTTIYLHLINRPCCNVYVANEEEGQGVMDRSVSKPKWCVGKIPPIFVALYLFEKKNGK